MQAECLMPDSFPTSAHLHNGGADALVRCRPPGRLIVARQALDSVKKERDGASRADQGGPPHHLCRAQFLENYAALG